MKNIHKSVQRMVFAASLIMLSMGVVACTPSTAPDPSVSVTPDTILLDVRTSDEYASGHLEGALQLDFNGGDVARAIPELDPEAEYFVYCRSGNRSGQAIQLMEQAGFTNLTNLGSVEQASAATGIDIVASR